MDAGCYYMIHRGPTSDLPAFPLPSGMSLPTLQETVTDTRYVKVKLPVSEGKEFVHTVDDIERTFTAPLGKKKGQECEFSYTVDRRRTFYDKMHFSVLVPLGYTVVKQLNVMHVIGPQLEYKGYEAGKNRAKMLTAAKELALDKVAELGCNALLGVSVSGPVIEKHHWNWQHGLFIVKEVREFCITGQPCIIVPTQSPAVVEALPA